jgi:hypothetical protein
MLAAVVVALMGHFQALAAQEAGAMVVLEQMLVRERWLVLPV